MSSRSFTLFFLFFTIFRPPFLPSRGTRPPSLPSRSARPPSLPSRSVRPPTLPTGPKTVPSVVDTCGCRYVIDKLWIRNYEWLTNGPAVRLVPWDLHFQWWRKKTNQDATHQKQWNYISFGWLILYIIIMLQAGRGEGLADLDIGEKTSTCCEQDRVGSEE